MKTARMVGVGTGTVQRIKAELRPKWTVNSLRPPTLADGPFPASDFNHAVAADVTAHLPSKTTPYFDDIARRYPTFPLQAELNRLCRPFNHEVCRPWRTLFGSVQGDQRSAVAGGLQFLLTPLHRATAKSGYAQLRPSNLMLPCAKTRSCRYAMNWTVCAARCHPKHCPH